MVLIGKKVQIRSFYNYSVIFYSLYSFFQWHVSVSFLVLRRESLFKQWLYCTLQALGGAGIFTLPASVVKEIRTVGKL